MTDDRKRTPIVKSFCGGVQGGQFFQKAPPWQPEAKGGVKERNKREKGRQGAAGSRLPAGLPVPSFRYPGEDDMSKEINTAKQVDITIRNRLTNDKRDVNVYHHFNRSSHIISYNSSITRGIKMLKENDYLHISVVSGPGHLKNYCILDLPSFVDFKFSLTGEEVTLVHSGERMLLRIPPGPPIWQLKMIIPKHSSIIDSLNGDYITIGDADQWPDSLNGEM
jgi:hypothetical protein